MNAPLILLMIVIKKKTIIFYFRVLNRIVPNKCV